MASISTIGKKLAQSHDLPLGRKAPGAGAQRDPHRQRLAQGPDFVISVRGRVCDLRLSRGFETIGSQLNDQSIQT
jgi:hypothetical protein